MRLPVLAILATAMAAAAASATPAAAMQPLAKPSGASLLTRVADLDRPAATQHRRKARIHRTRRAYGSWRERPVVITSGHPLHYFRGEIRYSYFPGDYYYCCRGGR